MFKIIKLKEGWSWYEHDAGGNTVQEGKDIFVSEAEAQNFVDDLNNKKPVADQGNKPVEETPEEKAAAEKAVADKAAADKATADAEAETKRLEALKTGDVTFPYTFDDADIAAIPALATNGVESGDIVDTVEDLSLAMTVHTP